MSASAMLLHRMLITTENRGWKAPVTSCGDPGPELTQTAPQGVGPLGWNLLQSQNINTDSRGNPNALESPQYSPTEHQKDRHG
jgi:hypothetical protein